MQRLRKIGWLGLISLLAVGITACSRRRDNTQVASEVQSKIRADGRMQTARIQVVATRGVVTLAGYVASSDQRAATVQDAAQVKGVRVLIDNLRIVDPNPQTPTIAMQKPSPLVRRRGNSRAGRPGIRTTPSLETPPAATPAAGQDPPSPVQTLAVHSATVTGAPPISPARAPAPQVLPERHAIDSRSPVVTASVSPIVLPTSSAAGTMSPAAPEQVTVPTGTELVVRLTESLSSDINEKGDAFLASLASPVMVGGRVVIPEDAGVEGKVVEVQSAGRFSGRPKLTVEITRLTYSGKTYEIRSSQYAKQGASRDARSVAAIGGGAGVGAIIGAILGGGRGAAIGSVIGAGAGTGAQAASKAAQVRLPAESMLSVRLQVPLTVAPSSTLQRTPSAGSGVAQDPFSSDDDRPVLKRRPGTPLPATDTSDARPESVTK